MESIISPWFVYLLSIVNGLGVGLILTTIAFGCTAIIALIVWANYRVEDGEDDEDTVKWKKIRNKFIIATGITFLLTVMIPSRNTIIAMYVTDKLTYDTAEKIIKAGKNVKDEFKKDVIDIIESITKDKDSAE